MIVLLGIVFIVLGLFFMTPLGAAVGARSNAKHLREDRIQATTHRATTVPGMMLTGLIFFVAGVYILVRQAS